MSRLASQLRAAVELLAETERRVPELERRLAEWTRGGLPGCSLPSGRGGEPRLPVPDRTDRELAATERWVEDTARLVLLRAREVRRTVGWLHRTSVELARRVEGVVVPVPRPPEEEVGPAACQNPRCDRLVSGAGSDRLRLGAVSGLRVCDRCRQHERRHGLPWPQRRGGSSAVRRSAPCDDRSRVGTVGTSHDP